MGFQADEDILQDFLVEAGEILEKLSEQLVDLEQNPDDMALLNAIFRGFHTVKGGAGFLQLEALVECCHVAENVFDVLRNGKRRVTPELMDVVLRALDTVNEMFDQVKQMQEPSPASPDLIAELQRLAQPEDETEQAAPAPQPAAVEAPSQPVADESAVQPVSGDLSDAEFERLLDALEQEGEGDHVAEPAATGETAAAGDSDDITDDEFEALLDQLHGKGRFNAATVAPTPAPAPAPEPAAQAEAGADAGGDDITDEEFEALLDQLHGKGRFNPSAVAGSETAAAAPAPSASASSAPASGAPEAAEGAGEEITEDEFEALLDQLHGKGKGPGSSAESRAAVPPAQSAQPAATAAPKAAPAEAAPKASAPAARPAPVEKTAPAAKPAAAASSSGDEEARGQRRIVGAPPAAREQAVATDTTVRVDTKRLDDIMNMVGELVLVRNRLKRLGDEIGDEQMIKAVSNLDVVTADLQSAVMQTRMQPIKKVFGRFPRVVRDLARSLRKEVNLELRGEETDLDKNLVEALSDPLVHLVRNAVDHGIEAPDVRERNGKPREGHVLLAAEQEGDHILLSIEDDGAGMDPAVLRRKAVEKGLYDVDAAERLTDTEAFGLIFMPGFSTKTEISDVSGRGVGMDVVKTKINQLNGSISVHSEKGRGTRIVIKVPLTLAIMPTLMVSLGNQSFALPLVSVVEIFHLDISRTNIVDGQECIVVRENVYPLFHIKRWLVKGTSWKKRSEGMAHVVIVAVGTKKVGFVVDQLIGQEEVVIKPLGALLHGTPGIAGATITGDGRIALILDIPSLLARYARTAKT